MCEGMWPSTEEEYREINRWREADEVKSLPLFKTMDEAIEAAAKYLPDGWSINLSVCKDGYGVTMETPTDDETDLDGGDGIRSDFWQGIMIANGIDI